MKTSKKIFAVIFAAVLVIVSLFGITALGARPASTTQPTQILAYYTGSGTTSKVGHIFTFPGTYIVADKPVLFTVSIDASGLDEGNEVGFIGASLLGQYGPEGEYLSEYVIFKKFSGWVNGVPVYDVCDTITFASTNMTISYVGYAANWNIEWHIMVQGSPDTVVTVMG